ncbi:MAG TPA: hypothetical protein VK186_18665 [Candidatus Deferrimicrobium sp.]|nr:hypothetical protein [Candidatus Deferrimicrobium sp.]
MKLMVKTLAIVFVMVYLLTASGCGGAGKVETEPQPVEPKEPSIEELRKPVAKDPSIYKVLEVLQKFGRLTKKYMSYEKYRATAGAGAQGAGAIDPDWFYDSYNLDMNENGYWANVTLGTAKKAKDKDSRIRELMSNLPEQSILVKLKTPAGKTYILSDAEADGILDFAKEATEVTSTKIDIQLLDQMQEKYTWLNGIIKKYYKN